MADKSRINAKELGEFLLEAKRNTTNTYASGKNIKELTNSGKQLVFGKGIYTYTDTYFEDDPNPFMGHEIVYKTVYNLDNEKNIPIWGMNYRGKLESYISANGCFMEWNTEEEGEMLEQVTNFLKKALLDLDDISMPFRGPRFYPHDLSHKIGELVYQNNFNGDIFDFVGKETIKMCTRGGPWDRPNIYQLEYHGGII